MSGSRPKNAIQLGEQIDGYLRARLAALTTEGNPAGQSPAHHSDAHG